MYYKLGFILIGLGLLFTCSPSKKSTLLSRNEAIPQRISLDKPSQIKNPREASLSAKGKTVEPISGKDLSKIIKSAAGRMHLFVFWTKDCTNCLSQMQAITTFANHTSTPDYQLVLINIDGVADLEGYSEQLQNQDLTIHSFWLNQSDRQNWQALLPASIEKNQPYVLAVQNDKNIFKYLKGMVSIEILHNFLHPLST